MNSIQSILDELRRNMPENEEKRKEIDELLERLSIHLSTIAEAAQAAAQAQQQAVSQQESQQKEEKKDKLRLSKMISEYVKDKVDKLEKFITDEDRLIGKTYKFVKEKLGEYIDFKWIKQSFIDPAKEMIKGVGQAVGGAGQMIAGGVGKLTETLLGVNVYEKGKEVIGQVRGFLGRMDEKLGGFFTQMDKNMGGFFSNLLGVQSSRDEQDKEADTDLYGGRGGRDEDEDDARMLASAYEKGAQKEAAATKEAGSKIADAELKAANVVADALASTVQSLNERKESEGKGEKPETSKQEGLANQLGKVLGGYDVKKPSKVESGGLKEGFRNMLGGLSNILRGVVSLLIRGLGGVLNPSGPLLKLGMLIVEGLQNLGFYVRKAFFDFFITKEDAEEAKRKAGAAGLRVKGQAPALERTPIASSAATGGGAKTPNLTGITDTSLAAMRIGETAPRYEETSYVEDEEEQEFSGAGWQRVEVQAKRKQYRMTRASEPYQKLPMGSMVTMERRVKPVPVSTPPPAPERKRKQKEQKQETKTENQKPDRENRERRRKRSADMSTRNQLIAKQIEAYTNLAGTLVQISTGLTGVIAFLSNLSRVLVTTPIPDKKPDDVR